MLTLARRRRDLGYSQQDLADLVGVHRVSVARFERGVRPATETQTKVARALDVAAKDLWLPEGPRYIDGPKLAAWIERRRDATNDLDPSLARRLRAWRNGSRASVNTADEWLRSLGRHLSELPDSFYR
jgi:transcriptional regulator with XRE-family HTH domain